MFCISKLGWNIFFIFFLFFSEAEKLVQEYLSIEKEKPANFQRKIDSILSENFNFFTVNYYFYFYKKSIKRFFKYNLHILFIPTLLGIKINHIKNKKKLQFLKINHQAMKHSNFNYIFSVSNIIVQKKHK